MPHALEDFKADHELFVGIDSDGCVFDSMEIKQKECFCPRFIQHFALQAISKYARETWEFVNLYSTTRGINRFKAVIRALELLSERPEVRARDFEVTQLPALRTWTAGSSALGNATLQEEIDSLPTDSAERQELEKVMAWSLAVNQNVAEIVTGVPPFPGVRESLEALSKKADLVVVSQTPLEALVREWRENDIDSYAATIAGQEQGSKREHLLTCTGSERYARDATLMIGDAPGDYEAAQAVGAFFYPILPGIEEDSWKDFHDTAIPRFVDRSWDARYQAELLESFQAALPENPPWTQS